ncbi:MAG TPA: hypothetical protein VMP01_23830 [Pirellulaceae bacterium]|nr:hypothetical protein [Pirellulaceae bacterium]
MSSSTRVAIALFVIVAFVSPLRADQKNDVPQDKKSVAVREKESAAKRDKKPRGEKGAKDTATLRKMFQLPENVRATLTPEQSAKAEQIEKEYAAKLSEAATTINAILTAERRKAQAEAAARALDALLSDQEKADLKAAQESLAALQDELRGKFVELLTDEQKSQLKQQRGAGNKKTGQPSEKQPAAPREKKPQPPAEKEPQPSVSK